jgi:YVTN family beta-propeller protein
VLLKDVLAWIEADWDFQRVIHYTPEAYQRGLDVAAAAGLRRVDREGPTHTQGGGELAHRPSYAAFEWVRPWIRMEMEPEMDDREDAITAETAETTGLVTYDDVDKPPPRPPGPGVDTPGVKIPAERLEPEAVFETGGSPDWLMPVEADGSVWLSDNPNGRVLRLDAKTNTIAATIAVGKNPSSGLAAGFGSLWVPICGEDALSRIDLRTNEITATFPTTTSAYEASIATGAGSIWLMTDAEGTLSRFDPDTNRVIATIQLSTGSYGLTFAEDSLWVTSTENGTIARVDPDTETVAATIPVGPSPRFIAAGEGAIWALDEGDGSVSRIDPQTNELVATIDTGTEDYNDIAVGEGSVWVSTFDYALSRIDPSTNQVVQQFYGLGAGGFRIGCGIRVGLGSLWVSNEREGNVWRLDPERVAATLPE